MMKYLILVAMILFNVYTNGAKPKNIRKQKINSWKNETELMTKKFKNDQSLQISNNSLMDLWMKDLQAMSRKLEIDDQYFQNPYVSFSEKNNWLAVKEGFGALYNEVQKFFSKGPPPEISINDNNASHIIIDKRNISNCTIINNYYCNHESHEAKQVETGLSDDNRVTTRKQTTRRKINYGFRVR